MLKITRAKEFLAGMWVPCESTPDIEELQRQWESRVRRAQKETADIVCKRIRLKCGVKAHTSTIAEVMREIHNEIDGVKENGRCANCKRPIYKEFVDKEFNQFVWLHEDGLERCKFTATPEQSDEGPRG